MTTALTKSAVIFGGSGGIGRVVADFFVSVGYGVTIAARTREPVERTVQELSCVTSVSIERVDNAVQAQRNTKIPPHPPLAKGGISNPPPLVKGGIVTPPILAKEGISNTPPLIKEGIVTPPILAKEGISNTPPLVKGGGRDFRINVCGEVADVTSFEAVESVIENHVGHFGGLDVIVNAAALQGPIGPLWKNDPHKWCEAVTVNLNGVFHVCRAGLSRMLKAQRGVIIIFSGGGAAYGRPNFSAYGASKAGMLRLVETIHEELRSDCSGEIQIYVVAPGAVRTRMTEEILACQDEAGERAYAEAVQTDAEGGTPPEKVAELCLYLAEQRPECLSGRLIHVNESYKEYVKHFEEKDPGDAGMLRRQPYK